jgi:hypothetical protein
VCSVRCAEAVLWSGGNRMVLEETHIWGALLTYRRQDGSCLTHGGC